MQSVCEHHTVIGPNANKAAFVAANTEAVDLSNAASRAMREERFDESISLHQQALALKLRAYPETSIQAAISLNGLGEALLRGNRLQEADEAFEKAIAVRESGGPRIDAAVTRDNIGALREAQQRFPEAREVRLRGQGSNEIMCGNPKCSMNRMCALSQLQACAACRSVFYCSRKCQAKDWTSRHKPLCQANTAQAATAGA